MWHQGLPFGDCGLAKLPSIATHPPSSKTNELATYAITPGLTAFSTA
jgi:hypothetical protein